MERVACKDEALGVREGDAEHHQERPLYSARIIDDDCSGLEVPLEVPVCGIFFIQRRSLTGSNCAENDPNALAEDLLVHTFALLRVCLVDIFIRNVAMLLELFPTAKVASISLPILASQLMTELVDMVGMLEC